MSTSFGSAAARFTPPVPPAIRAHARLAFMVTGLAGGLFAALLLAQDADLVAPWLLAPVFVAVLLLHPLTGDWPRPFVAAAIAGGFLIYAMTADTVVSDVPLSSTTTKPAARDGETPQEHRRPGLPDNRLVPDNRLPETPVSPKSALPTEQ